MKKFLPKSLMGQGKGMNRGLLSRAIFARKSMKGRQHGHGRISKAGMNGAENGKKKVVTMIPAGKR